MKTLVAFFAAILATTASADAYTCKTIVNGGNNAEAHTFYFDFDETAPDEVDNAALVEDIQPQPQGLYGKYHLENGKLTVKTTAEDDDEALAFHDYYYSKENQAWSAKATITLLIKKHAPSPFRLVTQGYDVEGNPIAAKVLAVGFCEKD